MKKLLLFTTLLCVASSAFAYEWKLTLDQAFKDAHKKGSGKYGIELQGPAGKAIKRVVVQVDETGEVVPLLEDVKGFGSRDVDVVIGGHIINLKGGAWCVVRLQVEAYDGPFAGQKAISGKPSVKSGAAGCHSQHFNVSVGQGGMLEIHR